MGPASSHEKSQYEFTACYSQTNCLLCHVVFLMSNEGVSAAAARLMVVFAEYVCVGS